MGKLTECWLNACSNCCCDFYYSNLLGDSNQVINACTAPKVSPHKCSPSPWLVWSPCVGRLTLCLTDICLSSLLVKPVRVWLKHLQVCVKPLIPPLFHHSLLRLTACLNWDASYSALLIGSSRPIDIYICVGEKCWKCVMFECNVYPWHLWPHTTHSFSRVMTAVQVFTFRSPS